MNAPACVDEILVRGLDDWIQAAEVSSVVRELEPGLSDAEVRVAALVVVRRLLEEGLMLAGDLNHQGFTAWSISAVDSLGRIERAWPEHRVGPELGEVCCFDLTSLGEQTARRLSEQMDRG